MQMTGHKTRSVFERYNIVSECDLVDAAQKLNVLQAANASSVRLKPDPTYEEGPATSQIANGPVATKPRSGDVGLAPPKRRSREGGHNSGTVEPDRGPRLKVSL
jgi:hypothetical protein